MVGHGAPMLWMVVGVALFVARLTVADDQKIRARVNISIVLAREYPRNNRQEMAAIKEAAKKLPDYFQVGPDTARLKIVPAMVPRTAPDYILTPNAYYYTHSIDRWNPSGDVYDLAIAFDEIKKIHEIKDSRVQVVVVIQTGFTANTKEAVGAAQSLLNDGVRIYTIVKNTTENGLTGLVKQAIEYTGTPTRVFGFPKGQFDSAGLVAMMEKVKDAIFRDLCQWDSMCRYLDKNRSRCEFEAWQPTALGNFRDDYNECKRIEPQPTQCKVDNCEKDCDRRWPWKSPRPDCKTRCGGAPIPRNGSKPPEKAEHCPSQFACAPCPPERRKTLRDYLNWTHAIVALLILIIVLPILGILVCLLLQNSPARRRRRKKAKKGKDARKAAIGGASSVSVKSMGATKSGGSSMLTKKSAPSGDYILLGDSSRAPSTKPSNDYIVLGDFSRKESPSQYVGMEKTKKDRPGDYILVETVRRPTKSSKRSVTSPKRGKKK